MEEFKKKKKRKPEGTHAISKCQKLVSGSRMTRGDIWNRLSPETPWRHRELEMEKLFFLRNKNNWPWTGVLHDLFQGKVLLLLSVNIRNQNKCYSKQIIAIVGWKSAWIWDTGPALMLDLKNFDSEGGQVGPIETLWFFCRNIWLGI